MKCQLCSWSDYENGEIYCDCLDWNTVEEKHYHTVREGKYCFNYDEREINYE